MIEFNCECGKAFRVDDKYKGKTGKCSSCGASLQIPGGSSSIDFAGTAQVGPVDLFAGIATPTQPIQESFEAPNAAWDDEIVTATVVTAQIVQPSPNSNDWFAGLPAAIPQSTPSAKASQEAPREAESSAGQPARRKGLLSPLRVALVGVSLFLISFIGVTAYLMSLRPEPDSLKVAAAKYSVGSVVHVINFGDRIQAAALEKSPASLDQLWSEDTRLNRILDEMKATDEDRKRVLAELPRTPNPLLLSGDMPKDKSEFLVLWKGVRHAKNIVLVRTVREPNWNYLEISLTKGPDGELMIDDVWDYGTNTSAVASLRDRVAGMMTMENQFAGTGATAAQVAMYETELRLAKLRDAKVNHPDRILDDMNRWPAAVQGSRACLAKRLQIATRGGENYLSEALRLYRQEFKDDSATYLVEWNLHRNRGDQFAALPAATYLDTLLYNNDPRLSEYVAAGLNAVNRLPR